jgi:hypothetical protein
MEGFWRGSTVLQAQADGEGVRSCGVSEWFGRQLSHHAAPSPRKKEANNATARAEGNEVLRLQ